MSPARRRGWECAVVLWEDYRDRLAPRSYSLVHRTARCAPEAVSIHRARRCRALFDRLVEPRQ